MASTDMTDMKEFFRITRQRGNQSSALAVLMDYKRQQRCTLKRALADYLRYVRECRALPDEPEKIRNLMIKNGEIRINIRGLFLNPESMEAIRQSINRLTQAGVTARQARESMSNLASIQISTRESFAAFQSAQESLQSALRRSLEEAFMADNAPPPRPPLPPPPPPPPTSCMKCRNYFGGTFRQEDNTLQRLVCGIHPYGWEGENCPDWEKKIADTKF